MSAIQASEVAEVFRQALRKEIAVEVEGGESWNDVYCGNVAFKFGDWRIVVFNDCWEFDYVDSVTAPDGRTANHDSWELDEGPVDLLSMEELAGMEFLVEGLTV